MRTISPCFHILRFPFAILWRYANADSLLGRHPASTVRTDTSSRFPRLSPVDTSDLCVTQIPNRTSAMPYVSTPFCSHARSVLQRMSRTICSAGSLVTHGFLPHIHATRCPRPVPTVWSSNYSAFRKPASTSRKLLRPASRFSMISSARSSGSGRLSKSVKLLSRSQKMSRLVLSRDTISSYP